jgi:hypothetical protein
MRNSTSLPLLLLAMALATPAFAQIVDDSGAGIDITPNAPAAVVIFPAPATPMISVPPPNVPDVLNLTTTGGAYANVGVPPPTIPNVVNMTTTGGVPVNVGVGANTGGATAGGGASISGAVPGSTTKAGTATSGATTTNPYCAVAADPQATAMGIDSTGCTP